MIDSLAFTSRLCVVVSMILCSCSEPRKKYDGLFEATDNIDIELEKHIDNILSSRKPHVTDDFDDFSLIPLENKEGAYLNQITKLQVCDSGFYVFSERESVLLRFRHNGEFASQIGEKGHGRGEYSMIINFCANDAGDSIYIMDIEGIKLYNQDGVFLSNLGNPKARNWQGFLSTASGFFFSVNNRIGDAALKRFDKQMQHGTPIIKMPEDVIRDYPSSWRNQLQTDGKKICYYDFYTSTFYIYNLSDLSECKSYVLHSENILTEKWIRERPEDQIDASGSDHLESYVFEDNTILGVFKYQGRTLDFKYNLETNNCQLRYAAGFSYDFMDVYDGYYYRCYDSVYLSDMVSPQSQFSGKQTYELLKDALEPYKDRIKETDNFYILKMRRKEWK